MFKVHPKSVHVLSFLWTLQSFKCKKCRNVKAHIKSAHGHILLYHLHHTLCNLVKTVNNAYYSIQTRKNIMTLWRLWLFYEKTNTFRSHQENDHAYIFGILQNLFSFLWTMLFFLYLIQQCQTPYKKCTQYFFFFLVNFMILCCIW